MEKRKETYIKFENNKLHYGFYFHVIPDGEKILAYIPAYDIYVPASSREEARERSLKMVQSFFKYWVGTEGRKKFLLQLHKLGFRSPLHEFTLHKLLVGQNINAKFKPNSNLLPKEFLNSESLEEEGELAIA